MKELACRDCKPPKRNPDCHSYCEEYLEWQKQHEKENKEAKKKKWLKYLGKK